MMVTGWYTPEPEKRLALLEQQLAQLYDTAQQYMSLDDHTQDLIWTLEQQKERLLKQLENNI